MVFSYNWLQTFFTRKLPIPKKLAEALESRVFEVENVEKIGKDWKIDIDVLPNRPDCMSHLGIAREIGAALNLKLKSVSGKLKEDKKIKTSENISVNAESPQDCPRYVAKYLYNVKVSASPKWLKEKLAICGVNSINNVVDAANFVMLELGQPLHCFDFDKIAGSRIIIRRAKAKEKISCLDGKDYVLDRDFLVIADSQKPLAIAGIKGGKGSEIQVQTSKIIIESANFDSHLIRGASRKLNLKTDASWRYEHGLDPNLCEIASQRLAEVIQMVSGAQAADGFVDFYPKKNISKRIKVRRAYIAKLLGAEIPVARINSICKALDLKIVNNGKDALLIEAPTIRTDLNIEEDIIEELARIYGYEKIEPRFPKSILVPPQRNDNFFWGNYIRQYFRNHGFFEQVNYNFIGDKDKELFNFSDNELIELENPLSNEYKYLRPFLAANLLKNVRDNLALDKEVKFFEIGKVFRKEAKNGFIDAVQSEKYALGILIASRDNKEIFFEAKGMAEALLDSLALPNIEYVEQTAAGGFWEENALAHIEVNGEKLGYIGEIKHSILEKMKAPCHAAAIELDFAMIARLATEEGYYEEFSKYPAIVRDISILLPSETRIGDALAQINKAGGQLLKDVELFDIYENEENNSGQKSLAFHLIYQSNEKTLTSEEAEIYQQKIITALEQNKGWKVKR